MTNYWNKMWGEKSSKGKPAFTVNHWTPPETKKDPTRNKGKVSHSVKDLTPEEISIYDHVTCTGCGGEVYPSAYISRDRCDLPGCWGDEAKLPRTLKIETDLAVTHSYADSYQGSYNTSMSKFSSFTRSRTTQVDVKSKHLLSRVAMPVAQDNYTVNDANGINTEHETLQQGTKKSSGDEFLSNVSEAYTHEIVQEVELLTRAVEKHVFTPKKEEESQESSLDNQWKMRQLIEHIGSQLGSAIGHKIGDEWFLRDTTEEAKAKQDAAGEQQQPAYAAGLYGETPPAKNRQSVRKAKTYLDRGQTMSFWEDAPAQNAFIGQAIDKLKIAPALDEATSKVAKAKPENRLQVMAEELMPLIEQIIEQQGGETDSEGSKKSLKQAMEGKGKVAKGARSGGYADQMQNYMDGLGKDIVDKQKKQKENDKRKAKWSQAAKSIAKAYGLDGDSVSTWNTVEPLYEAKSRAPKEVKLSWKASQMLEAVKSERRITTAEAGDPTDKMVELNFGNLKVFRKEEVYNPKLLIGVDTSGSTGCICGAGNGENKGSIMWEIATALSQAGTAHNTKLYGYGSSHKGHLTVIETPNGQRVQCHSEFVEAGLSRYDYGDNYSIPEHGGGTPELAMLHYLQDKAMTLGSLPETTVVLITDGQPDRPQACAEMSKEMVKAGVRFGSVVVGGGFARHRRDYYSSDVAVHVNLQADIEKALPKLFSLIQGRGIS